MNRPCFLVVDREFAGSISSRKLLIETAKFNVITAYSGSEALELFNRFPAVDGVVLDASLGDMECEELVRALKIRSPTLATIVIEGGSKACPGADFSVRSFDPGQLLDVLRSLRPNETKLLSERDEALNREAAGE
jgi:DNA-binding response OmpR family regulator